MGIRIQKEGAKNFLMRNEMGRNIHGGHGVSIARRNMESTVPGGEGKQSATTSPIH